MSEGATAQVNANSRRFAAFISYAHADAAIAAKLQSRLERYRLPKHIAATHASGRAALGQIFRDREDLAAAPSLSDAIRAAISEAEALVVICSPDAKGSRWVGEEIALFRALHPDRPILAAVVRAEPDEAFPAALTDGGNEPLAADLRREGDGEALGFLKIVAGIAGVPLDALVQRDAQRRLRRVTAITVGALTAMLIMGIMTAFAIQSRNEAARQRAEAEGLVEYMLTDLRDKLKGVGRLDVMTDVNQRATQYYGEETSKGRLLKARILHAMGEDEIQRQQTKVAQTNFDEAYRATTKAIRQSPDDPDTVFAHAQSEYWLGYLHYLAHRTGEARENWQAYLRLATHLWAIAPDDERSLKEVVYSQGNLCSLALEPPANSASALQSCAAALDAEIRWQREFSKKVGNSLDLANRYAWNAEALTVSGKYSEALDQRKIQIRLVEADARKNPEDKNIIYRLAMAHISMADLFEKLRNFDSARKYLDIAISEFSEISNFDKENKESRAWLEKLKDRKKRGIGHVYH